MSRCPDCKRDNRDGARFCDGCGASLTKLCPQCSVELRPDARFCDACGSDTGVTTELAGSRAMNPRAYTPNHLSALFRVNRSALEGERKQVTVMFVDVKGSMALAAQLEDEGWHKVLDRFFGIVTEGIHRFEGTVNQYTGDGVMALFGAPIAHEDHAQRACYAALHLRDRLREFGDDLRVASGINLGVRMGLNSGEVVVGRIGDDLRMDYTAQGHVVGLAQRMEQLAEPGTVLMTDRVARHVEGFVTTRFLGASQVRGYDGAVGVHVLESAGTLRTRLDRSRALGLSGFVGRESEVRSLELALAQVIQGQGRVVGVVAEAGTGKSRLCSEFIDQCRRKGLTVHDAWCPQHGRTLTLKPIHDLLRRCFGVDQSDQAAMAREKIAGRLLLMDTGFAEVLPVLFDFLGLRDPGQPVMQIEPETRQRRLSAFLRAWVKQQSTREPLLLAIDDLHWIDEASDRFVAQLVEAVQGTSTLLLLNFRPEYSASWTSRSWYQQLPLAPLTPADTALLLGRWLGPDPDIAAEARYIHEHASGNPLFIEEVVRMLIDTGCLIGQPGAYRLTAPLRGFAVPDSVQAILQARMDRLPAAAKTMLQQAALIGREVDEEVLLAVSGRTAGEVQQVLSVLIESEFLVEHSLYPERVYGFRHPLTRQVAEGSQLRETRRQTHQRIAEVLEGLHVAFLDKAASVLAHHWEEAGNVVKAVQWHHAAAKWIGLSDRMEESRHWRSVVAEVERLEDDSALRLAAEACWQLSELAWRGLPITVDERSRLVEVSKGLADRLADDRYLLRTLISETTSVLIIDGKLQAARALTEEIRHRVGERDDRELQIAVNHCVGMVLRPSGDLSGAHAAFQRVIDLCDGDVRVRNAGGQSAMAIALAMQADIEHWMARHRSAREKYGASLAALGADPNPESAFFAHYLAAHSACLLAGRDRLVDHKLGLTIELGKKIDSPSFEAMSSELEAIYALARGDAALALQHFESNPSFQDGGGVIESYSSMAARLEGRLDESVSWARESIRYAAETGSESVEPFSHIQLAESLIASGLHDSRDVVDSLARAEALISRTGAEGLRPLLLEARSKWRGANGDPAGAVADLRHALDIYRASGADSHAQRLEGELADTPG